MSEPGSDPRNSPRNDAACGSAAAYVLGALSCNDRQEFETHLTSCEECRRTLTELAGLPGLLSRVSPDDLHDLEPVPETLLPRLLAEIRGRSRRRRLVLLAAAAVVVAVLAVGTITLGPHHEVPGTAMTALAYAPIKATAALHDESHGTRIDVVCQYAGSVPAGLPAYELVVIGRNGQDHRVATWRVGPDGISRVVGSVDLARNDIATVEVRTATGTPVLRLNN